MDIRLFFEVGEIDGQTPLGAACTAGCAPTAAMTNEKCNSANNENNANNENDPATDLTATPREMGSDGEGVCAKAPNKVVGYTFITSKGVQRCFYVRNLPTSAAGASFQKNAVLINVNGYSTGAAGGNKAAERYGFTHIITSGETKDGLGGFAMEFGNNNVVNDANLTPCADEGWCGSARRSTCLDMAVERAAGTPMPPSAGPRTLPRARGFLC